jgi:hypothetical protein
VCPAIRDGELTFPHQAKVVLLAECAVSRGLKEARVNLACQLQLCTHHLHFSHLCHLTVPTVVWVAIAIAVAKFTRFFPILFHDERIIRPLFYASLVLMGINTVLILYLVLYLPRIKGITDSSAWDVYCPRVVPTATFNGILIAMALIRSVWPVWGFLSPLVLGVEAFGCLFALHFVPWL